MRKISCSSARLGKIDKVHEGIMHKCTPAFHLIEGLEHHATEEVGEDCLNPHGGPISFVTVSGAFIAHSCSMRSAFHQFDPQNKQAAIPNCNWNGDSVAVPVILSLARLMLVRRKDLINCSNPSDFALAMDRRTAGSRGAESIKPARISSVSSNASVVLTSSSVCETPREETISAQDDLTPHPPARAPEQFLIDDGHSRSTKRRKIHQYGPHSVQEPGEDSRQETAGTTSRTHAFLRYEDDEETKAIAQRMLDAYVADGTDPLVTMLEPFDDMSSEEEYDPNCGLPYVPRLKIDRRPADAVLMISGTLAQLESEHLAADSAARTMQYYSSRFIPWLHVHAMKQVAAEIHDLGAIKRSMERAELGPAPHEFSYVQLENQVYLVADDGDGSMVYIAEASTVLICRRP
ncbi:hypothetical protein FB451DRAFT_1187813 [Mycena latifolia]|nr:hypothetical protein FB451DRAFT_1187813 [Mycena latifolia]